MVIAADLDTIWGLIGELDAKLRAFCDAHGWHFPEHQQEMDLMKAAVEPVHTPFTLIAAQNNVSLIEAVLRHRASGGAISYDGMIGFVEADSEDGLFAFRCPKAKFEDFVPVHALCAVN